MMVGNMDEPAAASFAASANACSAAFSARAASFAASACFFAASVARLAAETGAPPVELDASAVVVFLDGIISGNIKYRTCYRLRILRPAGGATEGEGKKGEWRNRSVVSAELHDVTNVWDVIPAAICRR
jgi:hypothetical protein